VGALLGLAELEDATLVPVFRAHLDPVQVRDVRVAALEGWRKAAPADPALASRLRELVGDRDVSVRGAALAALGELHRAEDVSFLRDFAAREPDNDLAAEARSAAEEIEAFAKKERTE
jgi:hypothetical protein